MANSATKSTAPREIGALVENFAEHRDTYHRGDYKEASLRNDFLNPFFIALGWDVYNTKGKHEAYRDVILEQSMRVEKSVRAPDYCFRIGGTSKFFVEAKKPVVDIKSDVSPAFQLRRYAWTAKLPLSILTDFEEFAVYDCRIKPDKDDKASTARVMLLSYTDYIERWDEIASVFSLTAIERGSFDKYAESTKKKRGTAEVDEAFLEEIEGWRESLAKNLSLRNEKITDRELNAAVQLIIDRIIFLRMCEGREIEPYGRLQSLLNGERVYSRLVEIFHRADEKYNSGLFHFQREKDREPPDELTPELAVDDKVLKDILRRLYYPESPYEFAALPADILGQVYEQFLGKVIRLTAGHRAKIEEKPEVRKAGGVYYTPTYIVEYIVENTVGKLVEGKTPQEVGGLTAMYKESKTARPLAVVDPACGSGSFLIVAYQFLLDWYVKQYTEVDKPENHSRGASPRVYQSATGDWRLTTKERKRILLSHIYGVDIDMQAVEVTKLSLLLKVLEGETEATLRQFEAFYKPLPDLATNIKCGNSLIGSDFYDGKLCELFSEADMLRINAFDWQGEHGFPRIFAGDNPGFDAVIGNPPYVRMELFTEAKAYLRDRYAAHEERTDFYAYFVERGLSILRRAGRFGMILSNKFTVAKYGKPLRSFLESAARIISIADFAGLPVFKGATVRTLVLIATRNGRRRTMKYVPVPSPDTFAQIVSGTASVGEHAAKTAVAIAASQVSEAPWQLGSAQAAGLVESLESQFDSIRKLGISVLFGTKTGCNEAFIIDDQTRRKLIRADRNAARVIRPILFGREIRRYAIDADDRYVIYLHPDKKLDDFPSIKDWLLPHRRKLEQRAAKQQWYELQQPATKLLPILAMPKIIYPIIAPEPRFTLDREGFMVNDKAFVLVSDSLFILGLLNSAVAEFFFAHVCARLEGRGECYYEFRAQFVERFPIPPATEKHKARLESLVRRMLDLHERQPKARTDHERTALARQIEHTDAEIDRLVYELYGLTDDEIALVEGTTK